MTEKKLCYQALIYFECYLRKYDPVIIERTVGLVLAPSTTLYRSFLKHCTPTNKAVGTIYDGTCPNLVRGDKALILVPSDCYSGLLKSLDLSSLQDGRNIAYSCGCLYIYFYILFLSHIYGSREVPHKNIFYLVITRNFLTITTYVSRNYGKPFRNYEKLSRNYEKLSRNYEKLSRNYDKLSRNYEKLSRNNDKLSRNYEKLIS